MSRLTDEERRYIRELVDDIARKSDEFVERQAQLTAQRVKKILQEQEQEQERRSDPDWKWRVAFGLFVILVASLLTFSFFFAPHDAASPPAKQHRDDFVPYVPMPAPVFD